MRTGSSALHGLTIFQKAGDSEIVPEEIGDMWNRLLGEGSAVTNTEDVVNHPKHYNQYSGFEVIDVCEQLRAPDGTGNYNRGNAFKYLARAGWKNLDKQVEDLKKAKFYLEREIERLSVDDKEEIVTAVENLRCPQCNLVLLSTNVCPDGHGWMTIEWGQHMWMPPSTFSKNPLMMKPPTPRVHRCPECNLRLVQPKGFNPLCPILHGWLSFAKSSDGTWIPQDQWDSEEKPKSGRSFSPEIYGAFENCPDCGTRLVLDKESNIYAGFGCPNDHGWVRQPRDGSPATWVPTEVSRKEQKPALAPNEVLVTHPKVFYCSVCLDELTSPWCPKNHPNALQEEKPKSGLPQCPRCGVVLVLGDGNTRFCLDGHGRMSSVKETTPGVWTGTWTNGSDSVLRRGNVEIP